MPTVTAAPPVDDTRPLTRGDELESPLELPPPPEPTNHPPGSPEKVEVMVWRAQHGYALWHEGDAKRPGPATSDYRCHLHTYREPRVYRSAAG